MKLGLYNDVGTSTCIGLPGLNISATPDVWSDAQLQRDADHLVGLGMDFFKVDGCNPRGGDFSGMNVTYPKLSQALAKAAKKLNRPMPYYSCSWPDYVGDTNCNHERKEPCVPLHWIAENCHLARVYADIADDWGTSIKPILHFWADNPQLGDFRNPLVRQGSMYWNDPDQLMIGNPGMSESEWEAQMGMWVMWAAPLILSTEIRWGKLRWGKDYSLCSTSYFGGHRNRRETRFCSFIDEFCFGFWEFFSILEDFKLFNAILVCHYPVHLHCYIFVFSLAAPPPKPS